MSQPPAAHLTKDLRAVVIGAGRVTYLTFRDGWRYQQAIDAIRAGSGWHLLQE